MVGAVGADEFGVRLVDDLAAEGVDTAGVVRLPQVASGVAAIVVDERGENQIAVASGANHGLTADDVTGAFERLDLSRARCALFSFELEDEVVAAGAAMAAERGMTLVVNPAPARALARELLELGPVLTPNQGEAAQLTGQEDPEAAAAALVRSGAAAALVTAGERGVWVAAGGPRGAHRGAESGSARLHGRGRHLQRRARGWAGARLAARAGGARGRQRRGALGHQARCPLASTPADRVFGQPSRRSSTKCRQ